jgi:hypothetical protein
MKRESKWLFVVGALLLGAGCGQSGAQGVEAELCEHLEEGPFNPVTAVAASGTNGTATGADVSAEHTRHDISLGNATRSVTYQVAEVGEYVFGLTADLEVTVRTPAGAVVPQEGAVTSGLSCEVLKKKFAADLTQVGTYTLTFGGTAGSVGLVVEHAEHTEG